MLDTTHYKGRILIWQACYRSQACQANTHLDLGCIGQEPYLSAAAKPLHGQLASQRDKILRAIAFAGLLTIFTGKTSLPNMPQHFSGSFVERRVANPPLIFSQKACERFLSSLVSSLMPFLSISYISLPQSHITKNHVPSVTVIMFPFR